MLSGVTATHKPSVLPPGFQKYIDAALAVDVRGRTPDVAMHPVEVPFTSNS
jgi:hypothetical protein